MEFLGQTSFGIANYKWLGLFAVLVACWLLRPLVQFIIKQVKSFSKRLKTEPNSFRSSLLSLNIERPIASVFVGVLFLIALDSLAFPDKFSKYLRTLGHLFVAWHVIVLCYRMVDALGVLMSQWARESANSMDDHLVPFAKKSLKAVIVILGVLVFLQNAGVNVVALLAGLSLGGVALALAAQDTFANLLGSIMIFFDSPFVVGDHIKIGAVEGVVEEIGFRSTRIRSFNSSVITIPNSTVAKEIIDNWGVRQRRRIRFHLNVHYDTPTEKIEQFSDAVKYYLKNDQAVDPQSVIVSFTTLASSSLDILVQYYLNVKEYEQELSQVKNLNVEILKLAKKMNVDFAYPTTTVYYKGQPPI
jgi:MscS family membrane protein